LTITPWHWITATLAVTVSQNLTYGIPITNTATITYPGATTLVGDRVTITVPFHTYLPIVAANSVN
jgi:hypothetical protein